MKANQTFRNADEAVSPVIGVILMVAITVVLAAVVFVLVSNLSQSEDTAPNITFTKDEANDRLTVVKADADANWNRVRMEVLTPTAAENVEINWALNAAPTSVQADADTVADSSDPVSAGDYLEFCAEDSGGESEVKISLVDTGTNALIAEFTFALIGQDAGCV